MVECELDISFRFAFSGFRVSEGRHDWTFVTPVVAVAGGLV
jgi:hypothetical protein